MATASSVTRSCRCCRADIGDELLGGGVLVSELTRIFELCKQIWPEGITYCASSGASSNLLDLRLLSRLTSLRV